MKNFKRSGDFKNCLLKIRGISIGISILLAVGCDNQTVDQSSNTSSDPSTESNSAKAETWQTKFPNLWNTAYANTSEPDPSTVTYDQFLKDLASKVFVASKVSSWSHGISFRCKSLTSEFCDTADGSLEIISYSRPTFLADDIISKSNLEAKYQTCEYRLNLLLDLPEVQLTPISQLPSGLYTSERLGFVYPRGLGSDPVEERLSINFDKNTWFLSTTNASLGRIYLQRQRWESASRYGSPMTQVSGHEFKNVKYIMQLRCFQK